MAMALNGQSRVPPGFRFHPTEEELLQYYLRKKVAYEKIDLDVIREIDLNKLEPWDIQERCKIGSTPQNDWYFFSHKDKKYPTGTRTNRATAAGFWKATGRDKVIYSNSKRIGMRKTLVFYKGRAPHGQKSDWIMHEYRLDEITDNNPQSNVSSLAGETSQEEGWVVCRVFKKKNLHKILQNPHSLSMTGDEDTQMLHSSRDGALDQILQYMGRACKKQNELNNGSNSRHVGPTEPSFANGVHERFMQLPPLESPPLPPLQVNSSDHDQTSYLISNDHPEPNPVHQPEHVSDWAALDRLVASHLNGQSEPSFFSIQDHDLPSLHLRSSNDVDLWGFTRSSSLVPDPLCHVSRASI